MSAIKLIDPLTANEWLNNKEAILIDVREPSEYNAMHIPGSHLIPIGTIELNKLPAGMNNKKIIVHCKLGMRGEMGCKKLLHGDPNLDVYNIDGGIEKWKQCGLPVEGNQNASIDIARQVQIIAGVLILFGVICGFVFSQYFVLLSGFVGLGLLLSGITGYCGTARLLMHMPWNKK